MSGMYDTILRLERKVDELQKRSRLAVEEMGPMIDHPDWEFAEMSYGGMRKIRSILTGETTVEIWKGETEE